jgi:eukaryotic-like serine/threonine-protein kinase
MRLGAYEILAPLGIGGMGEVYRARDSRLGREVAIKVVSERLAGREQTLDRFAREARAVAALSHPNIVALHDIGSDGGIAFAVMELLDGKPLDVCIANHAIDRDRALEIAASIADGLSSAHGKRVVHRDLKPSNVFLTRDGHVKILDFGLAKHDLLQSHAATVGESPAQETEPGAVLGTLGYMSPEQARGEPADARSDIFALGCILYEMLSGRSPFCGVTPAETLAAILRDQPAPLLGSVPSVSPRVEMLIMRCLEKDPDRRFQSARDLAFSLRELRTDASSGLAGQGPRIWPSRMRIAAGLAVVLGAIGGAGWFLNVSRPDASNVTTHIQSIAVLPLVNFSTDAQQEYFADAMTEELTTRLAKLGPWRITSHTSVMGYRGTQKKVPEIARELGVDAIVEGSVLRDGSRVKVTAQLIDARTDRHIWADSFERELESIMTIQSDIARAIAGQINLTLTPEASAALAAATRPVLPAAYDAYVRGRHAWDKRGEMDLRDAIQFFQESIDADPTYAPAYAGLADSYNQLGYGSFVAPAESFPRARAAALKALELDSSLAEARAALGYARMYYDWDFPGAEREYKQAIKLNPNYAIAHQWYAYLLTAMERPPEMAEREIATAKQLDPLSVPILIDDAYILHYNNRNEEALRSVRLALEMNSKYAPAYFWLGRINTSLGRYDEAETALRNIGPLRTWTPAMAVLGYLYGRLGRVHEANDVLGEFEVLAKNGRYASAYAIAVVYAGLDERERALATLEQAYQERSHWLVWLKRDPRWNDIRADPRFQRLVRRVGLPS